ncbi:MAG: isopentenyl phosphate kinase family protein [Deltaproteobacteria bacterium]|nr:isopentenyl phosphate kinase family protein [Deltaproteobacteria bacterium]
MTLVLVKLGGSLITDKSRPYTVRQDVLDRLCTEIQQARLQGGPSLLIGNGAGSFAHVSAQRHRVHEGIGDEGSWEGFAEVHNDALRLNVMVREALTAAGVPAVTIQPSSSCITRSSRIHAFESGPIRRLLEAGLVPVVYGDVVVDEVQGCAIASTEEIFRHLASVLDPSRILMVGQVDGVLDASGAVIPEITRESLETVKRSLFASDAAADVTGGMLHKIERALETGVPTQILSGLEPGRIQRALLGESVPGTLVRG